jgi:hypothetical protein
MECGGLPPLFLAPIYWRVLSSHHQCGNKFPLIQSGAEGFATIDHPWRR